MKISDILTMFKVTGQAKGLDTFRFISDEDICVYLNQAIVNKVRSVVAQNSMMQYPGKSYINDNSISGTNILKNLHKVVTGDISDIEPDGYVVDYIDEFFNKNVMFVTSVDIAYKDSGEVVNCRIVDPDKFYLLDDDYCNKASWRNPIVAFYKRIEENEEYWNFSVMYGDRQFPTSKEPEKLFIHYIASPDAINSNDLDADYNSLPDYAIPEIVDIAVASYFKSVGATSQQLEQIQSQTQREND